MESAEIAREKNRQYCAAWRQRHRKAYNASVRKRRKRNKLNAKRS